MFFFYDNINKWLPFSEEMKWMFEIRVVVFGCENEEVEDMEVYYALNYYL